MYQMNNIHIPQYRWRRLFLLQVVTLVLFVSGLQISNANAQRQSFHRLNLATTFSFSESSKHANYEHKNRFIHKFGDRWNRLGFGSRFINFLGHGFYKRNLNHATVRVRSQVYNQAGSSGASTSEVIAGGEGGISARRLLEMSGGYDDYLRREVALVISPQGTLHLRTNNNPGNVSVPPNHRTLAHTHPQGDRHPGLQLPSEGDIRAAQMFVDQPGHNEVIVSHRGVVVFGAKSTVKTEIRYVGGASRNNRDINNYVYARKGQYITRVDDLDVYLGVGQDHNLVIWPSDPNQHHLDITILHNLRVGETRHHPDSYLNPTPGQWYQTFENIGPDRLRNLP